ncbi:urease accessory protein UreE [Echinimonas agarilytica]|uniref:Urease accessory protein UreE n=1 Tax=Echinimonas agarilytica TaxID=1215918 RepID=A0AA41W5K4_9GAMM|nr:urease accessory protein UreE [Echinimonas agarilytica]MCM2679161.1 urease accessory protein UreE [Echinimonas agarilytica]
MYRITKKSDHCHADVIDAVILPYELRQKGRFKTTSAQGFELGIFLPRGDVLRQGDYLISECGHHFKVQAQSEQVMTARTDCWLTFAKACYHLGNRHVPLQVGDRWLRFQPDHVLEEMVQLHGLSCQLEHASFSPESGAYANGGHSHGHNHSHEHASDMEHSH